MNSRRCLIPADGFYEWQKEGKRKLPILLSAARRSTVRVCRAVGAMTLGRLGPTDAAKLRYLFEPCPVDELTASRFAVGCLNDATAFKTEVLERLVVWSIL
jgi:SOS response associated peptidase (SRAP)